MLFIIHTNVPISQKNPFGDRRNYTFPIAIYKKYGIIMAYEYRIIPISLGVRAVNKFS